mgnify:CR=1 FL=1
MKFVGVLRDVMKLIDEIDVVIIDFGLLLNRELIIEILEEFH